LVFLVIDTRRVMLARTLRVVLKASTVPIELGWPNRSGPLLYG
jgi:hypothetical protein